MSKLDRNAIKKKKEEISNAVETNGSSSVLDKLKKKKKEQKYRTSVYLKPAIFEKIITLNAETGESFTEIIEMLLEDALQDVVAKPRHVQAYKENLERKQSNQNNNQGNKENE